MTDSVLASIDLGAYDIPGRQFRMRRIAVAPGGIVPWHAHATRPGETYVLKGRITEYRSTCADPIEHREGDVVIEQGPASHWWRNNTRRETILLSADILPPPTN
jgi:quercetin dioxygenase-like cupin family protein